jgi:hypothetical protein
LEIELDMKRTAWPHSILGHAARLLLQMKCFAAAVGLLEYTIGMWNAVIHSEG